MTELVKCGCSDPACPRMVCPVCRCEDCKWPGDCRGKCIECGAPAEPMPGCTDIFTSHCSPACLVASTARWEADGSLVAVGDLTLERLNEMLGDVGLALEGVGKPIPS